MGYPSVIQAAYRHGVTHSDIIHAYKHSAWTVAEPELTIYVGPDRSGQLLEIGVAEGRDDLSEFIVHAMPARAKYLERIYAPHRPRNHRPRRRTRWPL